ncbi:MAG: OmpP1/FadL family transporter [Bacteroidales bacterium]
MRILTQIVKLSAFLLMTALLIPGQAQATDGYFTLGYGARSQGMAGAGVALYGNSLFGATNPAGMVYLGKTYGISVGMFNPMRSFEVTGARSLPMPGMFPPPLGLQPGKTFSGSTFFPMPAIAANFMLGEKNALGISLYGNGGMSTDYNAKVFYSPYLDGPVLPGGMNPMSGISAPTGINLMQMFGALTLSHKFSDKFSLGLSGIAAWQSFEAKGLQAFANFGMSSDPANLTNNGASTSFGFGGKIGLLVNLVPQLSLGATFQTPLFMSEFKEYKGLFAEGGKFNVPANWTVGLGWKPNEKINVAFDVKQILYSKVKSVGNPLDVMALLPFVPDQNGNMVANPAYKPLGSNEGSGFGWKDMLIFKLGMEAYIADETQFRLGFSAGNNPVQESQVLFNILAPGVTTKHLTWGFSQYFGKKALDFAFVYAFNNTVRGANPLDPAQYITLQMHQYVLELGFRF